MENFDIKAIIAQVLAKVKRSSLVPQGVCTPLRFNNSSLDAREMEVPLEKIFLRDFSQWKRFFEKYFGDFLEQLIKEGRF